MEAVRERIELEFGRGDFRYVINTHADPDHSGGNQVFAGTPILAHRNGPGWLRRHPAGTPGARADQRDKGAKARAAAADSALSPEERRQAGGEARAREVMLRDLQGRYTPTPATVTFSDRLTLHLGDARIDLLACGPAHTDNDVLVHVPGEKVLLTGDLFCGPDHLCFKTGPPADVTGLAARIERLLADPAGIECVIPGHGPALGRADLVHLLGLLQAKSAAPGE
jgi:glyoxylase-like metal-dependent hydrolase (beta-lactamase superfamily II)